MLEENEKRVLELSAAIREGEESGRYEDLDAIWAYTLKTWSEEKADEYCTLLVETIASIAERPCCLDKEYVEIHPGLYRRNCHKHLVFYRLLENKGNSLLSSSYKFGYAEFKHSVGYFREAVEMFLGTENIP